MTDRPRMMVVEDDRDTAEMLPAYFEAQGYAVTPVAWGVDAVRQALAPAGVRSWEELFVTEHEGEQVRAGARRCWFL